MQGYLKRKYWEQQINSLLQLYPVVAVLGARQVGKSTLVKKLKNKSSLYMDLELPSERSKLIEAEDFFKLNSNKLICLDEIQLSPNLFPIIKGLVDQKGTKGQFLVLGSASRDLIRQSSQTLAGRVAFLNLTPFTYLEVDKADFYKHWLRGGYPESFLSSTEASSLLWRKNYIKTFLERDIPALGFTIPSVTFERLWKMLAHLNGQTLNSSKISDAMGFSSQSIKNYIDILEQTFVIRSLKAYSGNLKKRLIKSPKIYIRDTGLLHALLNIETINDLYGHPIIGMSYESWVIENICTYLNNWEVSFYRTGAGAEIDLVLEKGNEKIAIEIKASSSPKPKRGFWSAVDDIKATQRYIIAPVDQAYPYKNETTVINLRDFILRYINPIK